MASQSKKVFVEADAFYAFVNRAHEKYPQASAYFRYFAQQKYQVFTSYPAILETYSQIYEKISPALAKDFIRGISLSSVNIIYPAESDLKAALKTLINYRNSELTFPGAQSAVLANRGSISQICTFEYLHPLFGQSAFFLPM